MLYSTGLCHKADVRELCRVRGSLPDAENTLAVREVIYSVVAEEQTLQSRECIQLRHLQKSPKKRYMNQ